MDNLKNILVFSVFIFIGRYYIFSEGIFDVGPMVSIHMYIFHLYGRELQCEVVCLYFHLSM